jgi:hypothetical protein
MGFNPCSDDMTQRLHPAQDLHNIYRLANKVYIDSKGQKKKNRIERTVECLDYSNIYLNLRNEVAKLGDLINKIDNFLT